MSTVCLSGRGGGWWWGVANECHREVHYGTLDCCWFQNGGGEHGWAPRCSEMKVSRCWNTELMYLEGIKGQKMRKEDMEEKQHDL